MFNKEHFHLRCLERSDMDLIYYWRNSEQVRKYMFNDQLISHDEHKSWFEKTLHNTSIYRVYEYNKRPVGLVYFNDLDSKNNMCTWGFYLGEEDIPSGIGSVMGFMALKMIFEEYGFRKLCSQAFANNIRSIYYHKKLGFSVEGTLRKHILRNDKYEDIILLAYFKEQWYQEKQQLSEKIFKKLGVTHADDSNR